MQSRVTRVPLLTAVIGIVAILAGGCASSPKAAGQPAPQQAILLAATQTSQVNSIASTVTLQATTPQGSIHATGAVQEQLHPALLINGNFATFSVDGQSLPGGLAEVTTPDAVYLQLPSLMQELHISKPWVEIPLTGSGVGASLGALLSDIQSSNPVTVAQLLSGARDVRKAGTTVMGGVPVTEYDGSVPISEALAKLPANVRSSIGSMVAKSGVKTVDFKVWMDAQQNLKKAIVTETGTSVSVTSTEDDIVINQPVNVTLPPAAQTYVLPASILKGATSS